MHCIGQKIRLKVKPYSSPEQVISELRSVTCHMGSHSLTCHQTQVNTPRLNLSQTGRYSVYLPRRYGSKAELTWVTGYVPRWPTRPQTVTLPGTRKGDRLREIESNLQPVDHKSDVLTITLPSHLTYILFVSLCACKQFK